MGAGAGWATPAGSDCGAKKGGGGGEGGDRESRGGFGGHQVCIWGLDKGGVALNNIVIDRQ